MNQFLPPLACVIGEFLVFGLVITLFVLAQYHRVWLDNQERARKS